MTATARKGLKSNTLEAVVTAVLAVQNYSLEKAWGLLSALRDAGLLEPDAVAALSVERLAARLAKAGYDRGRLTEMMAGRFKSLMVAVANGDLDDLDGAVRANDSRAAQSLLQRVHGVGPQVSRNAWLLLQEGPAK